MLKTYDVTMPVHEGMPAYPGDPEVVTERITALERGDSANLTKLTMGTHAGTHVDPPFHFFTEGKKADELPLEVLIGPALVVDAAVDALDRAFIERLGISGEERVLFRTGGPEKPAFLTEGAARFLVEAGIRLVGVDLLSVERFDSADFAVHRTLLGGGVVILEGLCLGEVRPGRYEMLCLPLRLTGGDGAPARVVLRELA